MKTANSQTQDCVWASLRADRSADRQAKSSPRLVRCWRLAITSMVLLLGALRLGAATYQVDWQVLASAGGIQTSGHYALLDTLGQSAIGDSVASSYRIEAGFIPALDWLPAGTDTDHDGMPDDWELAHGLDPSDPSDAALDSDGDGLTNLQEYLAGTDPEDAADALAITVIQAYADSLQLGFRTISGRVYSLEFSDVSPDGPWTAVGDLVTGDGTLQMLIDSGGAAQLTRFYRVVLVLEP